MIQKTEAVVLKSLNHGDTSKIVTLYARDRGKLKLIAKGVRSPKSKAGGLFQPTRHLQIIYYEKTQSDLQLFKSGELINGFFGLESDFDRLTLAMVIVELLDRSTEDEESHASTFDLLTQTLKDLSQPDKPASRTYWKFHLQLLKALGYGPDTHHCAICGEALKYSALLGAQQPKLECASCHKADRSSIELNKKVLTTIESLLDGGRPAEEVGILNARERRTLWDFLWRFTFFHIEPTRGMRSLRVLKQLYS